MVTWLFVDFQMMRCFHFVGFPVMLLGVVWVRGKEELVYLLTNVTLQCGQWRAWEDNWVSFTQAVTLHPPSWWFLTGLPLSVQTAPRKLKPVIKAAAAAAKSLQLCPTLCDPIDGSPPGSPVPGILQARTLEWVAISFSKVWKWKVKVKSLSRVRPSATPWTAAHQAPPIHGPSVEQIWRVKRKGWLLDFWPAWHFRKRRCKHPKGAGNYFRTQGSKRKDDLFCKSGVGTPSHLILTKQDFCLYPKLMERNEAIMFLFQMFDSELILLYL